MSTPVLLLGESGNGKTYSLRNLDPEKTLLIQAIRKPLPFKSQGWKYFTPEEKGNIFVTDKSAEIITYMQNTKRKIIIIDDYQYILSNELMRRFREKGYDKFSEIGYNGWNLINVAASLPPDVHVYITAHTMTGDDGLTKIKTPGKLLETYSIEGMFSIVLRAVVIDGVNQFATKNSGSDTVKSPPGMFDAELIDNDLALVDKAITEFGW
jgi:hypothetical protein